MRYIHRELEKPLRQATKHFPALVLTGPRRAGKTWLLRAGKADGGNSAGFDPAKDMVLAETGVGGQVGDGASRERAGCSWAGANWVIKGGV